MEFEAAQAACDAVGQILVRGVSAEEEEEDYSEDEQDEEVQKLNAGLTDADIAKMRLIVITPKREEALDRMGRMILGDDFDEDFLMQNTSFSLEVLGAYDGFADMYKRLKEWDVKFDHLFAFTYGLWNDDVWMHDHEMGWGEIGGAKMCKGLARLWKAILKKSDAELGITEKYTRPGVIALCEKFKEAVEDIEDEGITFKFA